MLPICVKKSLGLFAVLALAIAPVATPAFAQVETVDPNDVIDADLAAPDYDGNFESSDSTARTVDAAPYDGDIDADIVAPEPGEAVFVEGREIMPGDFYFPAGLAFQPADQHHHRLLARS